MNEIPHSPVRAARAKMGLSQEKLAELSGISRRFIISLEQLIPEHIPTEVVVVLSPGNDPEQLIRDYQTAYNGKINKAVSAVYNGSAVDWKHVLAKIDSRPTRNAHRTLREYLCTWYRLPSTQIKWCTFTYVTPSVLQLYEDKLPGSNTNMPVQLRSALSGIFQVPDLIIDTVEAQVGGFKVLTLAHADD